MVLGDGFPASREVAHPCEWRRRSNKPRSQNQVAEFRVDSR